MRYYFQIFFAIGIILLVCNCNQNISNTKNENNLTSNINIKSDSIVLYADNLLQQYLKDSNKASLKFYPLEQIFIQEQNLKISQAGKDILAQAYHHYSNYYSQINKFDKVIACCEKYNLYAGKKIDTLFKCYNGVDLGNAYERLGDTKKAIVTLESCLQYAYQVNVPEYIALVSIALSNSYNQNENAIQAKQVVSKALLNPKISKRDREILLLERNYYIEDPNLAIQETKKLLLNAKLKHTIFYANCNLGNLYRSIDTNKAIQYYLTATKVNGQEKRMIAKTFLDLGWIYYELKKKDSAFYYLDQGFALLIPLKTVDGHIWPLYDSLYSENTIFDLSLYKANIILDDSVVSVKNINIALEHLRCAKKVAELIRKELVFDESKFDWGIDLKIVSEKLLHCYYLLYTKTNEPKYAQLAFMIAEESKATALQDNTEHSILANQSADTNYAKFIALRKQLNDIEVQQQAASTDAEKQKLAAESKAIILQLGIYKSLSNATINAKEKNYSFNELHNYLLKNNYNALSYFVGEENIYMLALNPHTNQINFAQCNTTIKDSVQELINLQNQQNIYSTQQNRFVQLSNFVYNTIFKKVAFTSTQNKTIILPDAVLNNLAFDALLTDATNVNAFLIKQQNISYAYSIRSLVSQQQRPFRSGSSLLAIAPFTKRTIRSLPQLHSSKQEMKHINTQFASLPFTDSTATFSNFQSNLSLNQYIHIASHASAGETPKLEFYDSSIHVNSIYQLPMNQSLAYLNTCQSGSGINYYSEGNLSLGRAFYSNGVHNIVLTLWNMNDASTATISNLFYKNLVQSNNSVTALHEAKIKYLESQPMDKQAPYYWASLQHVGDGNLEASTSFCNSWKWALGLSLLAFIGLVIYKKRKKI
jgi:CHAT domain-containing protein